ncbi:unnamed protein product [Rangifer tarandus platyrhynchus]|uniref:Uncharacterized protein n=1 Tax=Rangifer tarandus platyrhynchus TaxID=3082113 RepID=A0AC59YX23_RANTA
MEKSRMNLPKGPDTLCFDKDEFMKVRPGGLRSPSRGGWPVFLSLRGLLQVLAVHASDQPPARPRCLCSESFGLSSIDNAMASSAGLRGQRWWRRPFLLRDCSGYGLPPRCSSLDCSGI